MSGNSAFVINQQQGWRAGLKNLLRADQRRWWRTRTWWTQSILWICLVDAILAIVLFTPDANASMSESEMLTLYGVFAGMFASIGVIIAMQGVLVGEKAAGTASWVLSKPTSRAAFIISKLLSNGFGLAVTSVLAPGLVAFLLITFGSDANPNFPRFLMGIGLVAIHNLYWLALTLLLGAFFDSRGPVIGIPMALVLGQQFIQGLIANISPRLLDFLPYAIIMQDPSGRGDSIVSSVILGASPPTWMPVFAAMVTSLIFVLVGIWRFSREEF